MAINNQGGIFIGGNNFGNNTINNGQIPRNLDSMPELKAQMLRELPRDKAIKVSTILGDAEAIHLAGQVYAFLRDNGFQLGERSQDAYSDAVKGLHWYAEPNIFFVGSNLP